MTTYPQIYVASKYQEFIQELATVGKPAMVDQSYIKKLGYKSSYEANFLSAIKFIGLVEDKRGGAPTELWAQLRTDKGGALASGLKTGYAELFQFYPDAHLRDEEALTNFFRGNSDSDKDAVNRMVTSFVAIRELADFSKSSADKNDAQKEAKIDGKADDLREEDPIDVLLPTRGTVNLNIQLQLPSDATGEIYDKFFEAMKKHGLI